MSRTIIAVALLAALAGCASAGRDTVPCTILQQSAACAAVQLHPDNAAAAVLQEAPAGFAYLYIARPYAQQRSEKTALYLDDALVAELGPMSFVRLKVRPGVHSVRMRTPNADEAVVNVQVARSAFLEYQLAQHVFSVVPGIREIGPERAGRSLPMLERAVSTVD